LPDISQGTGRIKVTGVKTIFSINKGYQNRNKLLQFKMRRRCMKTTGTIAERRTGFFVIFFMISTCDSRNFNVLYLVATGIACNTRYG